MPDSGGLFRRPGNTASTGGKEAGGEKSCQGKIAREEGHPRGGGCRDAQGKIAREEKDSGNKVDEGARRGKESRAVARGRSAAGPKLVR